MPKVTFSIEKEPPKTGDGASGNGDNVELFHGIGNTLGFNITGGSDFSMPITIFHVSMVSPSRRSSVDSGAASSCGLIASARSIYTLKNVYYERRAIVSSPRQPPDH